MGLTQFGSWVCGILGLELLGLCEVSGVGYMGCGFPFSGAGMLATGFECMLYGDFCYFGFVVFWVWNNAGRFVFSGFYVC